MGRRGRRGLFHQTLEPVIKVTVNRVGKRGRKPVKLVRLSDLLQQGQCTTPPVVQPAQVAELASVGLGLCDNQEPSTSGLY